jgi:diguanylate cyclase (GGDEF)-like protein
MKGGIFIKFNKLLKYPSIFNTGTSSPESMRIQFVRSTSLIATIPLVIYGLYNILTGNVLFSITTWCTVVLLILVNILLVRTKSLHKMVCLILVCVYTMSVVSLFFGKVEYYSLIWMVCTPVITYYLTGSKKGLKINIVFLLFFFAVLLIRSPYPISYRSLFNIMFCLVFLCVILYSYEKSNEIYQIALEEKQLELERVSNTDNLTGLYNRKRIDRIIEEKLCKFSELDMSNQWCLILIDIDNFKLINDTYGHQDGDRALKAVANIILNNMKNYGSVARWGGEEFLVFIHDIPTEKVIELAEFTRSSIEQAEFENSMKITVSMGINFYCQGDTYDILLKRADDCLYKAKEQGRNCFIINY